VGLILLVELGLVFGSMALEPALGAAAGVAADGGATNTEAIGRLLYTDYFYLFQAAGIVLLVAMIGAMTLTMRHRPDARRQDIGRQVRRRRSETLEVRKVPPRTGI